jgi:hypothetical protein
MIAAFLQKLRNRVIGFYGFLGCFNLWAWLWAFLAFHDKPVHRDSSGCLANLPRVRKGGGYTDQSPDMLLGGGMMARIFRPLFRMISRPWHM